MNVPPVYVLLPIDVRPSLSDAAPPVVTAQLRILQTTDLHMNLTGFDYYRDSGEEQGGLLRLSEVIGTARAEVANSVLFDTGDFLQGSLMGDLVAREYLSSSENGHPMVAAMQALSYDAVALGNHEFNYGLPFLVWAIGGAQFPVLSSNIDVLRPDEAPFPDLRGIVLRRKLPCSDGRKRPISIGVFGLVPAQTGAWDKHNTAGSIHFHDPVERARAEVARLKGLGADIIIALDHAGISEDSAQTENNALAISALEGVDAILCGHQHRRFPGPDFPATPSVDPAKGRLRNKPAMMPGHSASHLGVMDLTLYRELGHWHIAKTDVSLRAGTQAPFPRNPPPILTTLLNAPHLRAQAYAHAFVGNLTAPLETYFALVSDCAALELVAQAQMWRAQSILSDYPKRESLPLLSAMAPFRVGGFAGPDNFTDIAAGPLAVRHLAELYHFPNTISIVEVSGKDVVEWLEFSAGMFNSLDPALPDQPLLRPEFPTYNFDVLYGLSYRFDLSQPARYTLRGARVSPDSSRVRDLRYNGQALDFNARFLVVTNSFRSGGGGHVPVDFSKELTLPRYERSFDILVDYVTSLGEITPMAAPTWGFVPQPGTTATFGTGPGAMACLGKSAPSNVVPIGSAPDGFALFRLLL